VEAADEGHPEPAFDRPVALLQRMRLAGIEPGTAVGDRDLERARVGDAEAQAHRAVGVLALVGEDRVRGRLADGDPQVLGALLVESGVAGRGAHRESSQTDVAGVGRNLQLDR
jgi:hypothetical protein